MLSFPSFLSVFLWTSEIDSNTLRVDAYCWKRRNKSFFFFSRISRIHADGDLNFLRWWIHFFYSNLYRKGSIITEFKLTFKTSLTAKEAMAPLKQETADGKLGSLEVDSNSLKLKDNNQGKWVEPWIHGISRLNIYGRWL